MAGTQGIGVFGIDSKFASGSLVFYEKAVGRTATGDVLTIGTGAVKVGGTSNDIDFQYYGTGSISAIIDCGAATFTLTGITLATSGAGISMSTTCKLVIPVKASGSTTAGDLWLDTTDNKLHFYNGSAEKTVTDS
jgi:hypothetical protein